MRAAGCCVVLALASLTGSADGLETLRHRHHNRVHSHALSHAAVHQDPPPCGAGLVRVFEPQLGCAQVSAPREPVDLVVVTESTCKDVLQGLRTKTAPYWDPEMNRCADETRTGLLTQCARRVGSNFTVALQTLCHFDTKVLDSAFHSVKTVPALPAVEVPTGAFVSGQGLQKRTSISISHEKAINANTHPDPKTPDKPNEKWAEYPTALTASAQRLAHIAQQTSPCLNAGGVRVPCGALAPARNGALIHSFTYSDVSNPPMSATPDDPVIVGTAENSNRVRSVSLETVVPAGSIKVASKPATPATPAVPNEKWARYPSHSPTSAALSMAVESQQRSGVLPSAPTVITVHHPN